MKVTRLGKFALEEALGSQTSSVFRAFHLEQKRRVAIKVFTEFAEPNSDARTYLSEEMHLLRKLKHPNVATCCGGAFDKQQGYVVWELIEGETLTDLLERRGRVPCEQALDIALQIAAALEAAFELGLTHLDLTPDKIMLTPGGEVKVLDFRCERLINPYARSTHQGTLLRSQYLSPERKKRDSGEATTKLDLYSLGCLLHAMLVGQPPFAGNDPEELALQHEEQAPPRVGQLVLDCPVWLDALTTQLLEKDPAKRPHSPAAVKLALLEAKRRIASGTGVTQHALGGMSALKLGGNREEVRKLVGRKVERASDTPPLYERPWFLAVCLVGLLCIAGVGLSIPFWPISDEQRLTRAEQLLLTDDSQKWAEARDSYLQPLLANDPNGPLAARASELLDQIAVDAAKTRIEKLNRLGLTPKLESERQLANAFRLEDFGDKAGALEKYQSLIDLLKPDAEDRPYALLAQSRIAAIRAGVLEATTERGKFIQAKLAEADAEVAAGHQLEAMKIWQSILSLYGDNPELAEMMGEVRNRIADRSGKAEPAAELSSDQ